ncbi:MAG: type 4a pilus biogenesis protein PilO [Elusimicrobiota bacterium]
MAQRKPITNQQKVVIAVLIAAGMFMFYKKIYAPLQVKIQATRETLEKKEAELENMKRKARELAKLEKEYKLLAEKLKETEKRLPKTTELPKFIRTITDIAGKYGMDVDNLSVMAPSSSEYYVTYSYKMALSSDYHTFGRFFTEIINLERLFNMRDVIFTLAGTSSESTVMLSVSFTLVTYTSKE